jgi:hypothetical protein
MSSEAERHAKLCTALMDQAPWCDQLWARAALSAASRAIIRGRLLTEQEKAENLAKAMEEGFDGDTEEERAGGVRAAEIIRTLARLPARS